MKMNAKQLYESAKHHEQAAKHRVAEWAVAVRNADRAGDDDAFDAAVDAQNAAVEAWEAAQKAVRAARQGRD